MCVGVLVCVVWVYAHVCTCTCEGVVEKEHSLKEESYYTMY